MSTTVVSGVINSPTVNVATAAPLPAGDATGRDRMAWNILATWGGHAVFVVSGFLMPRLIDTHLGQVALGLWDFAWSLVSYFVLAQIGVGSSVNRYVAEHRSTGNVDGLNRTVSSVNVIQMLATLIALALTAALMVVLPWLLDEQIGVEASTARWMIGLLGSAIAVQLAFNVYGGVLTGCHRWDIHNGVTAGAYALIAAGMIVALLAGGGLRALSAVYLSGTIIGEVLRMRLAYRTCPELRIHPRLATWIEMKSLVVFGGKTVVDNLSRLLLSQANAILVVSYLGPGALAVYARPGALIRHADTLTNKLGMVLSPAASSLKGSRRLDELKALYIEATRLAAFLAVPITVFLSVMGDPILQVWMGPEYRQGTLMAVMAIGTALPLTQRPAGHVLIGLNAHGRVGWASLAVAVFGVGAAVLALGPLQMGLIGAALALVIPYSLGNGVFVLVYTCRIVGVPTGEFCRRAFLVPLISALPLVAGLLTLRVVFDERPVIALAAGLTWSAAVMLPILWFFVLPDTFRARVLQKLRPSAASTTPSEVPRRDSIADVADVQTARVEIRPLPYPYKAALALCSDLDETPDRNAYRESARFLNTTDETSMGPGVGLEVGNTIYFDMPDEQFAYWNTDDRGRDMVRALIRSGHIDCLHSFGDLATTRAHAEKALDELDRHSCRMEVWIDHAVAPSNFGSDIMKGSGDIPGAVAYHADLTCAAGIRYVSRGRVTSVIGQNVPRSLMGIWQPSLPVGSSRTLLKEATKGLLGRHGNAKYDIHFDNAVLRDATLRDGHHVQEFVRSNPHPLGVSCGDTASGIAEVLTPSMLDLLIDRKAVAIIYTHLGKSRSPREPFGAITRSAFRQLAERQVAGEILVGTTRRLLGYCAALRRVEVSATSADGWQRLDIRIRPDHAGPLRESDLQGLTFYVSDAVRTRLFIDGCEVAPLQRNPQDGTGRQSVTIPWSRLEFPQV